MSQYSFCGFDSVHPGYFVMSNTYRFVQWNRHKRVYDLVLAGGVVGYLGLFAVVGKAVWTGPHAVADEVLAMRALSTCALLLLHVILCIGPLARLSPRFAPLLYNRRHLGVTMFFIALAHALLATGYYGAFGGVNPLRAVLSSGSVRTISGFPFEWLGLFAILILFVMAATSHDFWLANLGPRVWKRLHMGVYVAYSAVVLHVALGALQSERHMAYRVLLIAGVVVVGTLHVIAGYREVRKDRAAPATPPPPDSQTAAEPIWVDVAGIDDIPESRARVVCFRDRERIAVFRNGDTFSAVSNVCAHQGGPLGEGKVVGGCITCPWHGYQYLPHNGQSPPPYTEKVSTYQVRIRGERIEVNAVALPPGTPVEPATRESSASHITGTTP